jgi:cytochrome c oxidase subunit 3
MSERADLFHDLTAGDTMTAPRMPTFDFVDAPPDSESRDAHRERAASRMEVSSMGACLFVVVDGVLFGGLFGLYATLHASHPEIFSHGRYFLNPITGAVGNSVLLVSCLCAALSVRFARAGVKNSLVASLAATILLAGFYIGIQGAEYADKLDRGLLPGRHYLATEQVWETDTFRREHSRAAQYAERFRQGDPTHADERGASPVAVMPLLRAGVLGDRAVFPNLPSEPRNAHVFFGVYFLFSGVLALHVLGGAAVWMWLLARMRRESETRTSPIEHAALLWNFLAVVRVLMFPLFYLVH